jgi:polyphosphate glucokinase
MEIMGIDIGGSGIKGAPVNITTGKMAVRNRHRIKTPRPAKPEPVAETVAKIVEYFDWQGPIGCGFPAAITNGVARTAANIHDDWLGVNVAELLAEATGRPVTVVNDADAAGLAEMQFGAGQGRMGVVLIVTIGTGLGTALFSNGHLVPNTELGHIEIRGKEAEERASNAARKRDDLSWKKWAKRFDEYLCTMEELLWPDLIILGGGASKKKKYKKYAHRLTVQTEVVPACLRHNAGIIGAALAARLKSG